RRSNSGAYSTRPNERYARHHRTSDRSQAQITRITGGTRVTPKPQDVKVKHPAPRKLRGLTFQDLLLKLEHYWTTRDCILQQPYDIEVGAGTMHPETFLRVLGPDPYRVVYAQPSRRPADGRYGENPNRLYKHTQLQVILKPSPADIQDL